MKYLVSDFYSDYECIGGECPETCCGGWNIVIDDKSQPLLALIVAEQLEPEVMLVALLLHEQFDKFLVIV